MTMVPAIKTYIEILRVRRADILKTLEGLNEEALNWRPLPNEANSLYALALHSLGAERKWIHEIIGGQKIERDREAELRAQAQDAQSLHAQYDAAANASEQVLARLTLTELETMRAAMRHGEQSVRWCILRVIEHYNEHLGQMLLTRQLWENRNS
jgi:uncharacterized damage-inducible protein DinB